MFDEGGKQCHLGKRRNQRFVFVPASCTWEVRRTEPDVLGMSSATFGVEKGVATFWERLTCPYAAMSGQSWSEETFTDARFWMILGSG